MYSIMIQNLCPSHRIFVPIVFLVVLIVICAIGWIALTHGLYCASEEWKLYQLMARVKTATTRYVSQSIHEKTDEDCFQLEKRAFFSKTWLFICHGSLFNNIGDYRVFDFAGIPFFIVLGKDRQLRAFHNVCRHRAYTVVRRTCGTSTRFACKYHGWQYNDQGQLVKAPQFEESPNFSFSENGLFEVKLFITTEGLLFVNFDPSTLTMPCKDVRSNKDHAKLTQVGSGAVTAHSNWKAIATGFSQNADQVGHGLDWFLNWRKGKTVRPLGPMGLLKELEEGIWCTMNVWPISSRTSEVKYDLFAQEGTVIPHKSVQKWKIKLSEQIGTLATSQGRQYPQSFSYQCGNRTIDLTAILNQQERSEKSARKKSQPNLKFTGTQDIDFEAEALCDALETGTNNMLEVDCSNVSSGCGRRIEW